MARQDDQISLGELVGEIVKQLSVLIRSEIALAKIEIRDALGHLGVAAAFGVVAALMVVSGYIFFLMTLKSFFVQLVGQWLGELIVTLILLVTAGLFAFLAMRRLDRVKPDQAPERPAATSADAKQVQGQTSPNQEEKSDVAN